MTRTTVLLAAAIASVLAVDLTVVTQAHRATPIALGDALEEFRAGGAAPQAAADPGAPGGGRRDAAPAARAGARGGHLGPSPASPLAPLFRAPRPGVYAYATGGFEEISFGGGRHDYPDETFATLRRARGCRWDVRYDLIEEHVDTVRYCGAREELAMVGSTSVVTFFGHTDSVTYVCDPAAAVVRRGDGARAVHERTCTAPDGSTARNRVTYLGVERVGVGGVGVRAHRVVLDVELRGKAEGTARAEVWYRVGTGLVLRLERSVDTDGESFFGTVHYTEELSMRLRSLEPRT